MTNHPRMGCAFVEGFKPEILAPDVSLAATPAHEDVANGLQILYGTRDGYAKDRDPRALIDGFEAVARLLRQALLKLEQGAK